MANKENLRLFQILDQMNVNDIEKGSATVGVCNQLVAADYGAKIGGTKVTIGAQGNIVNEIYSGETIPVLLLINKKEYDRLNK